MTDMNTQSTKTSESLTGTIKELRQFAFIMAAMILFLFTFFFPWLYGMGFSYIPFIISALFAGTALIAPKVLGPVYFLWMKFAHIIGLINSKILLFIIFYLMIAPMGLAARLIGFNPMKRKDKSESYYIPHKNSDSNMEDPF